MIKILPDCVSRIRQLRYCPECGRYIKDYMSDGAFCYNCGLIIISYNSYLDKIGDIGPDWWDDIL